MNNKSANLIGIEGAKIIKDVLKSNSTLVALNISCNITEQRPKHLFLIENKKWLGNDIKDSGMRPIIEGIMRNTTLTSLNLSGFIVKFYELFTTSKDNV